MDYLGTMNINQPSSGTVATVMDYFRLCSGDLDLMFRTYENVIMKTHLREVEVAHQKELVAVKHDKELDSVKHEKELDSVKHEKELESANHETALTKEKLKTEQERGKFAAADAKVHVYELFRTSGHFVPPNADPAPSNSSTTDNDEEKTFSPSRDKDLGTKSNVRSSSSIPRSHQAGDANLKRKVDIVQVRERNVSSRGLNESDVRQDAKKGSTKSNATSSTTSRSITGDKNATAGTSAPPVPIPGVDADAAKMMCDVTVLCSKLSIADLTLTSETAYMISLTIATTVLAEACQKNPNISKVQIVHCGKDLAIKDIKRITPSHEGFEWAYDGLSRPLNFPKKPDWIIRMFYLKEESSNMVTLFSRTQVDEGFQQNHLASTHTRLYDLVGCISEKALWLSPMSTCTMQYNTNQETCIFSSNELNQLKDMLRDEGDIIIVDSVCDTLQSLVDLKLDVCLDGHCTTEIMLSFPSNDGPLDVHCMSVPTNEGERLLFYPIVDAVCNRMDTCLRETPVVSTALLVTEVHCVHNSELLKK